MSKKNTAQKNIARKKTGRNTIYTEELGERICAAIANSARGLRYICANNPDFPAVETIRDWLSKNTFPSFSARYARARQLQADCLADEIRDIAFDAKLDKFGRVEKPKLIIDSLKWTAAKLAPKVYGERVEQFIETDVKITNETSETISDKIAKITQLIDRKNKIHSDNK